VKQIRRVLNPANFYLIDVDLILCNLTNPTPINPLTITINRSKTRKLPHLPAGGHSQMRELDEVFFKNFCEYFRCFLISFYALLLLFPSCILLYTFRNSEKI